VPGAGGKTNWLDEQSGITTTFRPGYTEYQLAGARVTIAPTLDFHGFVCRVEFAKETPLLWQYGGIWWQASEANTNRVEIADGIARITEPNLPNGLVLAACDGEGKARAVATGFGQQAEFVATKPRRVYHIAATWGITRYDDERARKTMARLDTPNAAAWPQKRDELKKLWFDCHIGRALEPEKNLRQLLAAPADELRRTREHWDARRAEFQIRTPDARLNALINWARCVSEYHRQGPGLVLGGQTWQMYSHISTGWYGKQWAGDHAAMEECLRFYGAMQGDNGFVRWISPSLVAFNAENNTPYWVDQVWRHYTWTGDRQFVRDMWPAVRKAVAWMRATNDPDGDGLFRDAYEYWNCDSNGKGPKSAAPSAMSWAMLDRAARMAAIVGDAKAESEYRALAEKTRAAIFRELWNEKEGRLGCIGADGFWRGHPQTWEEYLAINAGLLNGGQGRRAMRWLASHYGFEPQPGVKLLMCSDWWPIRWSCQWVPTGDTCLAALAGMKIGDADLWWPYLKTVVGSAFRSEFPGINMGISNTGAGGGDREDVDSDDPHMHVAVRGLFGIEPALHERRLDICPAFPSDWCEASIRTPDVSYVWKRDGDRATFRIRTSKPIVKRVRASLGGEEVVTPAETESVVTLKLGPVARPLEPTKEQTILAEQQPLPAKQPLTAAERSRLVLFDLAPACNVTSEEFVATRFIFDHADRPSPLSSWWCNPALTQPASPRAVAANNGVVFLTAGRPRPGLSATPKNLLALASWQPHPLPGGATIPVGQRCERLWLLLQSYVHPMKNYLSNGEVVLRYADGTRAVTSLIPPFNLDCYFQHFSREGVPVPMGQVGPFNTPFSFVPAKWAFAHADALEIACDATRVLESLELRATCSEAVIGLAGMTALAAEAASP
ncbi:MAG: GH116 family glycosyl hydrolase, partial [Verrucomicrobia bacterium]|nr:GH116 family glycosyl hydrolase [Verrucomicrobiota bacterium]